MKKLSLLVFTFTFIACTFAQNPSWFKGTVTDEAGNPITWASIIVKDKEHKFTYPPFGYTGKNGEYSIILPCRPIIDSVYSFPYKNPFTHEESFYPVYKCDYSTSPFENDTVICYTVQYEIKMELMEGNNIINFVLHKKQPKNVNASFTAYKKYSKEEMDSIQKEINFMHKIDKHKIDSFKELKRKLENNEPLPQAAEDYDKIFTMVLVPAAFPGGDTALTKFIEKNISYPDSATNSNFRGVVKVAFTIDKKGDVLDLKLIKGVNKFADEEVFKVIRKMPQWQPAIQNGRVVEDTKEISVLFDIKGILTK